MPRLRSAILVAVLALVSSASLVGQIRRNPNGVNVNAQGATSVFITFGALREQIPVEAFWCGELIPASPDLGSKCAPGTIFGQLPLRYDQSQLRQDGTAFTDIMTIPPSVARRAYQAAAQGQNSAFFYVRRFESLIGGLDEYVFVTCRMTGGGARVPLALHDVELRYVGGALVYSVERGGEVAPWYAEIAYTGTGRLQGRWEVVLPGDDPPRAEELLPAATLPLEQRALRRRFTLVDRFNVFLPPTGRTRLEGPAASRLPTELDGLYQILLRVEASDDKEADSNLASAGAGDGVVHSGAVSGFPMPVLRYYVGSADDLPAALVAEALAPQLPEEGAVLAATEPVVFSWALARGAIAYRLIVETATGEEVLQAILQQGIGVYRAPSWLAERAVDQTLRWRVVAIGPDGGDAGQTAWRAFSLASP